MKEQIIATALTLGKKAADYCGTDDGKKMIFGTYTDGSPRSLVDAWNDEIMSPKSREKRIREIELRRRLMEERLLKETKKSKKKKKKKKNKKKSSGGSSNGFDLTFF